MGCDESASQCELPVSMAGAELLGDWRIRQSASGRTIAFAHGNGHGGDLPPSGRDRQAAEARLAAGAGCGSWPHIWMCTAALPTWSPASKRGMAGRSAESGGLRARWWRRRWRDLVLGRWWLLRRIRGRSMRLRAIWRSSANCPCAEFPAWEAEPGERVVHDEIYGERLRVLKALAGCEDARMRRQREHRRPTRSASRILDPRHQHSEFAAAGAGAGCDGGGDAGDSRWRRSWMSRS